MAPGYQLDPMPMDGDVDGHVRDHDHAAPEVKVAPGRSGEQEYYT